MSILASISEKLNSGAKFYFEQPARFFQVAGVIGFATSCLCQALAIVVNKTIPAKEKKFLIPQELTDGAVNIAIFLAVTNPLRMRADKWAKTKVLKWLNNPEMRNDKWLSMFKEITQGMKITENKVEKDLGSILVNNSTSLKKIAGIIEKTAENKRDDLITLMAEAKFDDITWETSIKKLLGNDKTWQVLKDNEEHVGNIGHVFKNNWFNKGAQLSAYLAGQLIAINIIAPIVRNKVGSIYQKKTFELNNIFNKSTLPVTSSFCSNTRNPDSNISNYLTMTKLTGKLRI